jgi:hypothetical protein
MLILLLIENVAMFRIVLNTNCNTLKIKYTLSYIVRNVYEIILIKFQIVLFLFTNKARSVCMFMNSLRHFIMAFEYIFKFS